MNTRSLTLAMCALLCGLGNAAEAQEQPQERSVFKASVTYGFYSPSDNIRSCYASFFLPDASSLGIGDAETADDGHYGGLGLNLRLFFPTDLLGGRLRLGGECTVQMFRWEERDSGPITIVSYYSVRGPQGSDGGGVVAKSAQSALDFPANPPPSLNGLILQFMGDLKLFAVGSTDVRCEAGFGPLFFWSGEEGDIPFSPTTDFAVSARLAPTIGLRGAWTVDPHLGILKTFGKNNVTMLTVGVGTSYSW
ncbi:MAG: hypothetical protein FJ217_12360 [Ignavibacteria bacterium]|nr:hypothetical protein [Ignavibacteria bacterium]